MISVGIPLGNRLCRAEFFACDLPSAAIPWTVVVTQASQKDFAVFFFLSKTVGIMLLPSNFLIGVGIVGLILLLTRLASLGRKLTAASVLLLAICGFSPVANLLLYPLESRFPPWDASRGAPDGIVVLGGSIEPDLSAAHGVAVFGSSLPPSIASSPRRHLRAVTRMPASYFPAAMPIWFPATPPRKPISRCRCSKVSAFPKTA